VLAGVALAVLLAACSSAQAADGPVPDPTTAEGDAAPGSSGSPAGGAGGADGDGIAPPGPALPGSETLAAAATDRVDALCAVGSVRPDPSAYRQETWAEVVELVGRGRTPADAHAGWSDEELGRDDWDRTEVAATTCDDGLTYAVRVLTREAVPSDAGPYGRVRFPAREVVHRADVPYGLAEGIDGRPVGLLLDLFVPPGDATDAATGRPTLVLVHGGGFAAGSRADHADDAVAWARRGFVVATVDYRLDPDAGSSAAAHRAAGFAAIDDAMEAVRWLRVHAGDHGIDPVRIAAIGASAGGSIALGLALQEDLEPGGPWDDLSPQVAAAVSTGAHLTPVQGVMAIDADDAPVLVHHYERDTESGRSWDYAARTCAAVRAAGDTCDLALTEGRGHTVGIGPDSAEIDRILAFLAVHLRLDE
jgi:acetyl esterase/lipase